MRTGGSVLRGTKTGLEFVFTEETFDEAVSEFAERLEERPGFYRGSRATAHFVDVVPSGEALGRFLESVRGWGIELSGVYGEESLSELALFYGLEYLGTPPKPVPSKKVPSASIKPPLLKVGRENTFSAGAEWAEDASVMGCLEFARK